MQRNPSHLGSKESGTSGSASKPATGFASIGPTGGSTGRSTLATITPRQEVDASQPDSSDNATLSEGGWDLSQEIEPNRVLRYAADALAIVDKNGSVLWATEATERIAGVTAAEAV